jgi:DNA-binding LacI/PurR family transcriptional regulator
VYPLRHRIRDVAERAKVSTATVSRVLNGSPLVDDNTRRRVLEISEELNYYRNASAQRLRKGGRSDFYGLIISDITNPVFPEMIKGFETAAAQEGFDLFLCATNYDENRTQAAIRKMIENGVRGVAIMTSSVGIEVAEGLAKRQIAVVLLDTEVHERFINSLLIDYSGGVGEALDHLKHLGHRKVTFLAGQHGRRSARRYRETVVKSIHEHGLKLEQIIECDQTLEGGRDAVSKFAGKRLPSAILCINDFTAIGLMAALHEVGIRVPEEVSIIGCEDIYLSSFVNPPLTTVRLDRISLGAMAFSVLKTMPQCNQERIKELRLDTHLVIRGSTGLIKGPQPV